VASSAGKRHGRPTYSNGRGERSQTDRCDLNVPLALEGVRRQRWTETLPSRSTADKSSAAPTASKSAATLNGLGRNSPRREGRFTDPAGKIARNEERPRGRALPASSAAKATPDIPGIVTSDTSRSIVPSLVTTALALRRRWRHKDAVAPFGQHALGQFADRLFILYQEHRLGAEGARLDRDRGASSGSVE